MLLIWNCASSYVLCMMKFNSEHLDFKKILGLMAVKINTDRCRQKEVALQ